MYVVIHDRDDDGDNDNDGREASLQEMILVISMTIAMKFLTESLGGDINDDSDGIVTVNHSGECCVDNDGNE